MILNAAGYGGIVSPISPQQSSRKLPPWAWAAIALSVAAHVAGAAWLHYQKTAVIPEAPVDPKRPPVVLIPYSPVEPEKAPAPAEPTRTVRSPATPAPTEPLPGPPLVANPGGAAAGPVSSTPAPVDSAAGDAGEGTGRVAEAAPPSPGKIENPKWVQMPTAGQMERYYPRRALEREISGSATIRCRVATNGSVDACAVLSETPAGQGFGEAALKLSRFFRMSPKTVDGAPVEGAAVDIGLAFRLD